MRFCFAGVDDKQWFYATVGHTAVLHGARSICLSVPDSATGSGDRLNKSIYWGIYITNFVVLRGYQPRGHPGFRHLADLAGRVAPPPHHPIRRGHHRDGAVSSGGSIPDDLGRPDRLLNVLKFPRSVPLLWDVTSISVYLTGSVILSLLPLHSDVALIRPEFKGPRRHFYRLLALGWSGPTGSAHPRRSSSHHGVTMYPDRRVRASPSSPLSSAMTVQPCGTARSSALLRRRRDLLRIAALIVAMAVLRKVYHLEEYLKPIHFNYLASSHLLSFWLNFELYIP